MPFCGHATIAGAVALADRDGPGLLSFATEDPATGAAAAAFGGYLRELGLVTPPVTLRLHQGHDLGRPSLLTVHVPEDAPGIRVTGTAVPIKE